LYGSGSPLAEGLGFYSITILALCVDEHHYPSMRRRYRVSQVNRVMAPTQFHFEREARSCPAADGEADRITLGNIITSTEALWLRLQHYQTLWIY